MEIELSEVFTHGELIIFNDLLKKMEDFAIKKEKKEERKRKEPKEKERRNKKKKIIIYNTSNISTNWKYSIKYIYNIKNNNILLQLFDELWKIYPRTRANQACGYKKDALNAYEKLIKAGESHERIREQLVKYKKFCENTGTYNIDFSRWLKNDRWKEQFSFNPEVRKTGPKQQDSYTDQIFNALGTIEQMEN